MRRPSTLAVLAGAFALAWLFTVGSIMWFTGGPEPLRQGHGQVGRPFWAGPPRPQPPIAPPGWPGGPSR